MSGIDHDPPLKLSRDASGQSAVGVDDIRLQFSDKARQAPYILRMKGTLRQAVHFIDGRIQFCQLLLQQTAPGQSHHGFKTGSVRVLEIVDEYPSGAANVAVGDDVEN